MKNKTIGVISSILIILYFVFVVFFDVFSHGFFSNAKDFSQIPSGERNNPISMISSDSSFSFVPQVDHFSGFDLYFFTVPSNDGEVQMIISDNDGQIVDIITINLKKLSNNEWYKVKTNKELKKGKQYVVVFSSNMRIEELPSFLKVREDFLPEGITKGNIFIGFAYKKSTFSFNTKLLLGLFILGAYCAIIGSCSCSVVIKQRLAIVSLFLLLTALLSWNYLFNSMDSTNDVHRVFQQDSESLVTDRILAEQQGLEMIDSQFGLGHIDSSYKSQYGLQGKVFRHIARLFDKTEAISNLYLLCSLITAGTFVFLVFLIDIKYNRLMACSFLITFWLSPWIVNFARNLFWVEFTWFIPMVIGLFCSIHIDSKGIRIGCFVCSYIAIAGKCLCGYEYISTIMMGLVAFLVIDLLLAIVEKDKKKALLLFKTVLWFIVMALAGFATAILFHAPLRGNGSILEGIRHIIQEDVLRRTNGGDLNNYNPVYWDSLNASIWETCCKYFHFSTEIITGISGNLFPLLCIVPLVVFAIDIKNKKSNYESIFLYGYFFLATISWFCLAKSHSYIHTHMNYVLWYFGFVQTCLYIISEKIIGFLKRSR